jgi:TonB-dependent SusC/RagA subfamily outer membrane receptor
MILTRKTVIIVSVLLYSNSICAQNIDAKIDTLSLLKNVSGSAATVSEGQMNKGLVNNALDALSGKAAGVNVSSNGADRMAMLSSVRVRGTTSLTGGNDPLVIIDGVYSDLSTLSTVYPADIESFTILKNAAETAQYGSRGASGVIVVKTKKGHGQQFHISYDVNGGFESVYKNINMLNRSEYISTSKALGTNYNDGGYDTNFLEAITRTGYVQNHHMAFSGGGEKSNYRASIGFMDHNTIIKINKYQNFVAKLDLSQKAFDDILTIDFGVFGSSQNSKNIFDTQKLFYSAAAQNPTYFNGMNSSGGWDKNSTASQINNPLALLKEKNDEKNLNFNTHIQFLFEVTHHLKAILFGSYSYNSTENSQFCPTWVWAQGQAYRGEHKNESWLGNIQLNYNRKWGIHSIDILALSEYQHEKKNWFLYISKRIYIQFFRI